MTENNDDCEIEVESMKSEPQSSPVDYESWINNLRFTYLTAFAKLLLIVCWTVKSALDVMGGLMGLRHLSKLNWLGTFEDM